jgi:predicted HicB family RNase H-like nuclease
MMEYKGYLGTVEYDAEAKLFHGDIINTRDVITFQGTTVKVIEKAFKDSIEDYLSWGNAEYLFNQHFHQNLFYLINFV